MARSLLFIIVFFFHFFLICPNVPGENNHETPLAEFSDGFLDTRENEDLFDSLIDSAWDMLVSNPDSARLSALEAYVYRTPGDNSQEIRLLNLIGITYFIQSEHSRALEKYLKGLTLALEEGENQRIADIYNNIGIVNLRSGNYMDALENFLEAIEYYKETGDIQNKASTFNNIGLLYSAIENFEKARENFDQAYQVFTEKKDSVRIAACLSNMGSLFLKMEQIDSALIYFEKAIDIGIKTQNNFGLSATYSEVAKVFSFKEDYAMAIEFFQKSNDLSKEINYPYKQCKVNLGLARAYLELGQTDLSLIHAETAMSIADRLSDQVLRQETHEVFAKIYEKKSDFEKAFHHFRKSTELKEVILDQAKLHQIYNIEIQELSQAKEIQRLEIERQELLLSRKNTTIFFITLAFFLVMAGLYLLYHNYRYRQLANHQKDILDLTEKKSRAAVEAEIQERKRIGQELHDGLGQMLSVARLNISVLQQKASLTSERKEELLDAAIQSVDKAFYELRDISHNLAPSVLSEKGFAMALKELFEQVNKTRQMHVHFESYGLNGPIDSLIENTLYRAVQELLNNAIKHAQASDFFLQLVKNDSDITLIVEDNGVGFDMEKILHIPGGGLNNIRSRVENLNGNIFIDTMTSRGTIVTIVIPLKKPKYVKKSYSSAGSR